ncbi:MAG: phosphoglycerate dehydrogenase [Actinobacteria bacterium]|nr:phosphoglycerate dehydrogenase [Actinomycetota bacterium]
MTKPRVLIAEELSPATVEALGPDFEIINCDGSDRVALLAAIVDVDAILVRSATMVDAEAIAAAPKLKVVARAGVGLDNVDVKAATQAGVMVVNAPTSNIVSAAELAVALLLASARNVAPASAALSKGEWKRSKYTGVEVAGKVVGIVGLGRIGVLVAQRMSAFGVKLIAYDPYVQPARAAQLGVRMVTLDDLLAESDFITVHLPKTAETVGLIGDAELHKVNVDGRVAGAGLDVYAKEPCTDSPLFGLESVVATPHLGASTDEAQEKAGISVARSVRLALAGELVPDAVNVQGGQMADEIKPLLPLAEKLGAIACGLASAAVARVTVEVFGEAADHDVRVLELSALKGVFQMLVHDPVSFVNAPVLAEQRGVEVVLTTDRTSDDHKSVVRVTITLTGGESVSVAGTVAGPRHTPKVVEVDGFDVDVPVSDHMAFLRYHDKPGVVGIVGKVLGDAGVNIGGMQVSRDDSSHALIMLTVDSPIPAAALDDIVSQIGAHSGKSVDLN